MVGGDTVNVGNLIAKMQLDISSWQSSLRKVSSSTRSLSAQLKSDLVAPMKQVSNTAKDVSNIVRGIVISKVFYGSLNAIESATAAVVSFCNELEYAQQVYTNLFGDTQLAQEFINVLQDYAAVSPFEFSDLERSARMLKAYGIQTENLMYLMQGITSAAVGQGTTEVIDSIARALGQMYTKGKVSAEEIRQLANAGIPAMDILREKLGLTGEQVADIGNQSINASDAINALVDGMTERYGGLVDAISMTRTGMMAAIKDNLKLMASAIFTPMMNRINEPLAALTQKLSNLRQITSTQGLGGLFVNIVPKDLQAGIKQLIANIITGFNAARMAVGNFAQIFRNLAPTVLTILNAIGGAISFILQIIAGLTEAITNNAQIMKKLNTVLTIGIVLWGAWKARLLVVSAIKL